MTDKPALVNGLSPETWRAMFRPGMPEFAATRFAFSVEVAEQVRIAFGNEGPYTETGESRSPVYTHAVTLSPATAIELARTLLKSFAEPLPTRSKSSGEL